MLPLLPNYSSVETAVACEPLKESSSLGMDQDDQLQKVIVCKQQYTEECLRHSSRSTIHRLKAISYGRSVEPVGVSEAKLNGARDPFYNP